MNCARCGIDLETPLGGFCESDPTICGECGDAAGESEWANRGCDEMRERALFG